MDNIKYNLFSELNQSLDEFGLGLQTKTVLPDSCSIIQASQTGLLQPMFSAFTKVKMNHAVIQKELQPNIGNTSFFYNSENVEMSYETITDIQNSTAANLDDSENYQSLSFSSHIDSLTHLGDSWIVYEAISLGRGDTLVLTEERKNLGEELKNNQIKTFSIWDSFLYSIKNIKNFFSKYNLELIYQKLKFETGIFIPIDIFNKFLESLKCSYLSIGQKNI